MLPSESTTLRHATLADLAAICSWFTSADEARDWGGPLIQYPLQLEQLIDDIDFLAQPSFALVASPVGVIGFGQIRPRADYFHLARIAIAPAWRNRGLGRQLLAQMMVRYPQAPGFSLYVYRHNQAAWRCYQGLGFEAGEDPSTTAPDDRLCQFMIYRR